MKKNEILLENQELEFMYMQLQEKFLQQQKLLDASILYIEKQSGGEHTGNLYFKRYSKLPDFCILRNGVAKRFWFPHGKKANI